MSPRALQRSRLVGVLVFVLAVALCAVAVRLSEAGLEYEKVSGRVDQTVAVEGGWIRVENVRVGDTLARRTAGAGVETVTATPGLFLAAEVTVAATGREAVSFGQLNLVTGDRAYASRERQTVRAVAGFSQRTDVVWEVDPEAIDDLTVQFLRGALVRGFDQRPAIFLGIDASNAQAWREAARGRPVVYNGLPVDSGLR